MALIRERSSTGGGRGDGVAPPSAGIEDNADTIADLEQALAG